MYQLIETKNYIFTMKRQVIFRGHNCSSQYFDLKKNSKFKTGTNLNDEFIRVRFPQQAGAFETIKKV